MTFGGGDTTRAITHPVQKLQLSSKNKNFHHLLGKGSGSGIFWMEGYSSNLADFFLSLFYSITYSFVSSAKKSVN